MTDPRWLINLTRGGKIVITRRDGEDLDIEDLKTVRLIVSNHFRARVSQDTQGITRPEAGSEVQTRASGTSGQRVKHTLDPIVNFFTVYRRKRFITLKSISPLASTSTNNLTSYEIGHRRPFIEALRDWGYALGFNIMPIPLALSLKVRDMVNAHLEKEYAKDLNAWGSGKTFLGDTERSHADFSSGREFLRDSDYSRPEETRETAPGDVSNSSGARGSEDWLD